MAKMGEQEEQDADVAMATKDEVTMITMSDEISRLELRQNMIDRLTMTDAHFKHQQRGEPDLTQSEKCDIASKILEKNPITFLSRYGSYLIDKDLKYFLNLKGNYEVEFYLGEICKRLNSSKNKVTVKNRRYEAMKELLKAEEYFSDEEMKWRDPYLYEQMIGQYLTDEEVQQCVDKSDLRFSTILLKHLDQQQENSLYSALKDTEEGQVEEEEDESGEEEKDVMQQEDVSTTEEADGRTNVQKISNEDKQQLREEFLSIMQERFMSGQDKQFDYSKVDGNTEYDSLKIREQDEEEKYFDKEDSETMDFDITN